MKKIFLLFLATTTTLTVFAKSPKLTADQAVILGNELYARASSSFVDSYSKEWADRVLTTGEYKMPFWCKISGEKPAAGYAMYISMHGGGGGPVEMNNKQWSNQKRLYGTVEGLYFVPRSPTDSWNMWHQEYMDSLLLKAVTYAVNKLGVDPNRIYLTGYSAGGDGTFNLAPRMADRFAAAAMMAGHPGDAVAENLRNLPFAIYMGGLDGAFNRNGLARDWSLKLDNLQKADPQGYTHRVVIYDTLGHWMNNNDKEAIPWLASFTRNPYPNRVVWVQDDVTRKAKNWIEVQDPHPGQTIIATYNKQTNTINIEQCDYPQVTFRINDQMLNLDKPVTVTVKGEKLLRKKAPRTEKNIEQSIATYMDPAYLFPAALTVKIPTQE